MTRPGSPTERRIQIYGLKVADEPLNNEAIDELRHPHQVGDWSKCAQIVGVKPWLLADGVIKSLLVDCRKSPDEQRLNSSTTDGAMIRRLVDVPTSFPVNGINFIRKSSIPSLAGCGETVCHLRFNGCSPVVSQGIIKRQLTSLSVLLTHSSHGRRSEL